MPLSTVSAVLLRIGLGKRSRLEPPEPPNRYQRERPGELVHIDVKKLGRIERVGHRITGNRASQNAREPLAARQTRDRLGVRARLRRRRHPPGLRRGARTTRKATTVAGFLRRAVAFYAATASPSSA